MKRKERKYKTFVSLNLKITVAIFVGIFLAVCMYIACAFVENYVTEVRYTSDHAVETNIGMAYDSLEEYIAKNEVKGSDSKALSSWVKTQEYTYLTVYDNYNIYFESGWWSDPQTPGSEVEESNADAALEEGETGPRIDRNTAVIDTKNRIIQFDDQEYYVFIDQYREQHWQQIMDLATLFLCFLTLLVTILVYNGRMLKRIILLATEVQRVSDGDLDYHIYARHNDEIGELADAVDNMRTSILEKHKNEKEAWDANTQLITAMSHDVRTPLTSMIGYLDIIEGKKYENVEQLDKYVSSCREKSIPAERTIG